MALKFDVGSNTREAVRGVKDIGDELDKVVDALDDVTRESGTTADKTERTFRDMVRDASKAERAVADVGDKGFRKAGESTGAFKDEAVANFSEVASSFSGDITEMADGVQGLTGGLASALTPGIGIPIAILGAVAGAFLQSWIDSSEEAKQRISDMYTDMTDSGNAFVSEEFIRTGLVKLGEDQDQWNAAQARHLETGFSIEAVMRAMVGDSEQIDAILASQTGKHESNLDYIRRSAGTLEEKQVLIDAENTKYGEQTEWLHQIQKDTDTAASKAEAVNAAIARGGEAADTTAGKVKGIGDALPKDATIDINVNDRAVRDYRAPRIVADVELRVGRLVGQLG